jgi:hypothetical protein
LLYVIRWIGVNIGGIRSPREGHGIGRPKRWHIGMVLRYPRYGELLSR